MNLQAPISIVEQLEAERRKNRRFNMNAFTAMDVFSAAFIGLGVYAVDATRKAHARFMSGCMEDHKEYECTTMWHARDKGPPSPAIIFVPSGR